MSTGPLLSAGTFVVGETPLTPHSCRPTCLMQYKARQKCSCSVFFLSFSQKARLGQVVPRPWKCRCFPFSRCPVQKLHVPFAPGRLAESRCQEECPLDTWLGAQAQKGLPTHMGPSQREEGRKSCNIGFPQRQACNLPGPNQLISKLVC